MMLIDVVQIHILSWDETRLLPPDSQPKYPFSVLF